MKRVCSGCGVITEKRRCPDCARKYEAQRGPRTMKGRYDAGWVKLRARAIAEHPWCSECGSTEDLTGDHIVPHRNGGRNVRSNIQVLCRGCNARKGARPQSGAGSI